MTFLEKFKPYSLPLIVGFAVAILLSAVQLKVEGPMLLAERFIQNGGWAEILLLCIYGGFLTFKMQDVNLQARYRLLSWSVFSMVFFGQLMLGLLGIEQCLMTGELHFPIPAMILVGPLYRWEISFMTILFLSTIILSGPAWCSQFCYFGAIDGFAANREKPTFLRDLWTFRWIGLVLIVFLSLAFRFMEQMFSASHDLMNSLPWIAVAIFGAFGLMLVLFYSRRKGTMVHCVTYCPIGTVVSLTKWVNPIRIKIDSDCTKCMQCLSVCRYDAIDLKALELGKPKLQCTNCGDCLSTCHGSFIHYSLFKLRAETARSVYLGITITIHVVFLGLARI